jgi:hypothetical protein
VEAKPKVKAETNGSSEPAVRMATLRSDNQEMTKEEVRARGFFLRSFERGRG